MNDIKESLLIIGSIIIIAALLFWGISKIPRMSEIEKADSEFERSYYSCLSDTRYLLSDLADTWGNNTNNQDAISKSMLEFYNKCLERAEIKHNRLIKEFLAKKDDRNSTTTGQ